MDLLVVSGVAAASLFKICSLSKEITSIQFTLNEMKGLQTYSPIDLYNLLKSGKDILFKESEDGETLVGKAFIQGKIDSKYPIKSILSDRDLVYRKFYVDNLYSNDRLYQVVGNNRKKLDENSRRQINFRNDSQMLVEQSPFIDIFQKKEIKGYQRNFQGRHMDMSNENQNVNEDTVFVRILKNIKANYTLALDEIGYRTHTKRQSFAENLIIYLGFIFEFIFSILHLKIRGRGIKVGYLITEFGLPIQTFITVFGELIYYKKTGKMVMSKPQYLFKQDASLKNYLNNKIGNKRILLNLLYIPLVLSAGYLYKRLYIIISQYMRKYRQRMEDQLKKIQRIELDNFECITCKSRTRNIILQPCNHLNHCDQCFKDRIKENNNLNNTYDLSFNEINSNLELLANEFCPTCKNKVNSIVELYVS